jgi:adenylosuccinate synthase
LHGEIAKLRVPRSTVANEEHALLASDSVVPVWIDRCQPVAARVVPDAVLASWLADTRAVIFEGAQGLLLDQDVGFHPHTTWSRCTAESARDLLREVAPTAKLEVIGVLRAHAVRHGPGPLPTESAEVGDVVREHNATNAWQGPVRRGWFDAVLARYAIALTKYLDALLVTHVDALARRPTWSLCDQYEAEGPIDADIASANPGGRIHDLLAEAQPPLERQTRLGRLLQRCRPILANVASNESAHLDELEQRLHRRIDVVARGPRAGDVEVRTSALADGFAQARRSP